jgi:hypothetical protein
MFTIESVERLARDRDCRVLLVADEAKEIEDAALRDLANDCATFVTARLRKARAGLVSGGRADGAIERLWQERIEPFVQEQFDLVSVHLKRVPPRRDPEDVPTKGSSPEARKCEPALSQQTKCSRTVG